MFTFVGASRGHLCVCTAFLLVYSFGTCFPRFCLHGSTSGDQLRLLAVVLAETCKSQLTCATYRSTYKACMHGCCYWARPDSPLCTDHTPKISMPTVDNSRDAVGFGLGACALCTHACAVCRCDYVLFTEHFRGQDTAVGPMCVRVSVCPEYRGMMPVSPAGP